MMRSWRPSAGILQEKQIDVSVTATVTNDDVSNYERAAALGKLVENPAAARRRALTSRAAVIPFSRVGFHRVPDVP